MTTIQFLSGVREIGGVIVSVTHHQSRVIFDFGTVYTPATHPFDGFVLHRERAALMDEIRLGRLPAIDGIYPRKELGELGERVVPAEQCNMETAVLISHLHLDHMSGIGYVHPSIPVYMEEKAFELLNALQEIGEGTGTRNYQACRYGETFSVGEIKVTSYFSDHAVWGTAGFLIETPSGKIFWTGDVRMHGLQAERAYEELHKLAKEKIDVLIMEGSTLTPDYFQHASPELKTEKEYIEQIGSELWNNPKLCFFNIYHRDIERVCSLIETAKRSDRNIAFEPQTAYIMWRITNHRPYVYVPDFSFFQKELNELPAWLRQILNTGKLVTPKMIMDEPEHWFVQNSYPHTMELFDYAHIGGVYLHLDGIPLGSFDPAYANLQRILQKANITYWNGDIQPMFGHAIPEHLEEIVRIIDPPYLAVVHTERPERLVPHSGEKLLPEVGETYVLDNGKLWREQEYAQQTKAIDTAL